MKRLRYLSLLLALVLLPAFTGLSAQAPDVEKMLAVLDLNVQKGLDQTWTNTMTQAVVAGIISANKFQVIDRANRDKLLSEQALQCSDMTDNQCRVQMGKMLGVGRLVTGSITKVGDEYIVNLQMIRVQTGQILSLEEYGCACSPSDLRRTAKVLAGRLMGLVVDMPKFSGPVYREGLIGSDAEEWTPDSSSEVIVQFKSTPEGAMVEINDQPICNTPCRRALGTGSYTVAMKSVQYVTRRENISVVQGMQPVSWTLQENFGWLSVTSDPAGLPVKINGKASGSTPIDRMVMSPGGYEVLVISPQYIEAGKRVQIDRSEHEQVSIKPTPRQGAIKVSATDSEGNAIQGDVHVDGAKVGRTYEPITLLIGTHEVEVRSSSGNWKGKLEVTERQVAAVTAKLVGEIKLDARRSVLAADEAEIRAKERELDALNKLDQQRKKNGGRETSVLSGDMVLIPGGSFMMGCVPGDSNCSDDERPRHRVTLDSFYMDKYEVTQGEYERVMGKNPSSHQDCGSNCPVENVSWNDAQSYCKKVSKRLPTEAEWEYAARGGLEDAKYPWGDEEASCSRAVMQDPLTLDINGCGIAGTWPVGSKPKGKNGYGLYDMTGNVWEWCSDWYGSDYYSSSPANNPAGPSSRSARVLRGGSWVNESRNLRASNRGINAPTYGLNVIGFRCVRD